ICNGACDFGYADCNGNKQTDGCEVSLKTDPDNCNACGTVCSGNNLTRSCVNGACNGNCNAGYTDCNNNKQSDGCEIHTSADPNTLGTSGPICPHPHITAPTCGNAICNGTCDTGWADCNNNKQLDGCEAPTSADVSNCGGCNKACSNNHITTPTCGGGVCNGQ